MTRSEFEKLPTREWDQKSMYDSVIFVPCKKKHDSGYSWIDIVGVNEDTKTLEVAGSCDAFHHDFFQKESGQLGFDCLYKSKYMRAFSRKGRIEVGHSLSTITFKIIPRATH